MTLKNARVLYISYNGMLDPLGQSQVIPYLKELNQRGVEFTLLSFERPEALAKHDTEIERMRSDLAARGLATPNTIKRDYDFNPGVGGPIVRDRLWFYSSARFVLNSNYVAGLWFNKNAGNPNAWTYEPDTSRKPAFNDSRFKGGDGRVTWQANQKNKFAVAYDYQNQCNCPRSLTAS